MSNAELTHHQSMRYSRHVMLPAMDFEGQEKLLAAKVLVVGVGGLGCACVPYLAAGGVGQLTLADDDVIEFHNLQRQILFTEQDIGQAKAEVAARHLRRLNSEIRIDSLVQRLDTKALETLVANHDLVVDCCVRAARAGDVTYCRTAEGWMYLAVVMDLYSRRIVGWHMDKRMTTDLVCKALTRAYSLRQPPARLVFHSDRGSQYTSKRYRKLLRSCKMRASMGDVGACWDSAVVERFFGSLKHDWLYKVAQPTREHMKADVAAYMRYYNLERLHTANGDMSPVDYENTLKKVSGFS